jgi:hypothetical protein
MRVSAYERTFDELQPLDMLGILPLIAAPAAPPSCRWQQVALPVEPHFFNTHAHDRSQLGESERPRRHLHPANEYTPPRPGEHRYPLRLDWLRPAESSTEPAAQELARVLPPAYVSADLVSSLFTVASGDLRYRFELRRQLPGPCRSHPLNVPRRHHQSRIVLAVFGGPIAT